MYQTFLQNYMPQPFLPYTTTAFQIHQESVPVPLTFFTFQGKSTPCLWIPNACHTLICNQTKNYLLDIPSIPSPRELTFEKNQNYFGITFFLGILPSNLLKTTPSLFQTPAVQSAFSAQISFFLSSLTPNLHLILPAKPVQQPIAAIAASNASLNFQELSKNLSYSERQIRRLFHSHMNYSPKTLSRILRFQSSLQELLKMPQKNNSEFIEHLSYSDQAHFQREFKAFTTMTPRRFIQFLQNLQASSPLKK